MVKVVKDKVKHLIIYLVSFCINYLIFIFLMNFVSKNSSIGIQVVNLVSWIISMLFIFFVDKMFVPDLVNENNSSELFKFILIRVLSLIIEVMILFIFVTIFRIDFYLVKLISLMLLFFFNHFYVTRVKFN